MINKILIALAITLFGYHLSVAQTITDVTPSEGEQGQRLTVQISGQNTNFTTASTTQIIFAQGTITNNPIPMDITRIENSNQLQGRISITHQHDTGSYDVFYENFFPNISATKEDAFRVKADPTPPEIINVEPQKAKAGESLSVSISGKNTNFDQGSSLRFVLTDDNSRLHYSTYNVDPKSSTEVEAFLNLPSDIERGFHDLLLFNQNVPIYVLEKNGFFVEKNGATAPIIQNIGIDTAVLTETHEFQITFKNGDLFQMDNPTEVYLEKGDEKIDASQVAIIDKNTVEPTLTIPFNAEPGEYDLVALYGGGYELRSDDAIYVKDENSSIGNGPKSADNKLSVYPNPVNEVLNFELQVDQPMQLKAAILNSSGQVVKQVFQKEVNSGKHIFQDVALDRELPSGSYYLKVTSPNNSFKRVAQIQKR